MFKFGRLILRVLAFLPTCQYIPPVRSPERRRYGMCCSCLVIIYAIICTLVLGMLLNLWPTVIFITDWVKCPIRYYGICYSLELRSKDPNSPRIPDIVLKYVDNDMTTYNPGKLFTITPFSCQKRCWVKWMDYRSSCYNVFLNHQCQIINPIYR